MDFNDLIHQLNQNMNLSKLPCLFLFYFFDEEEGDPRKLVTT